VEKQAATKNRRIAKKRKKGLFEYANHHSGQMLGTKRTEREGSVQKIGARQERKEIERTRGLSTIKKGRTKGKS